MRGSRASFVTWHRRFGGYAELSMERCNLLSEVVCSWLPGPKVCAAAVITVCCKCIYTVSVVYDWHHITPQGGGLKQQKCIFSHSSRDWKSKIKVPERLLSGESSVLMCRWLPSLCMFTWPFLDVFMWEGEEKGEARERSLLLINHQSYWIG